MVHTFEKDFIYFSPAQHFLKLLLLASIVYAKMTYILVRSSDSDETVELPTEDDNSLCLATLTAQFPDAIGLRYESPETGAMRGLRASEGKLLPPEDGWSNHVYFCTIAKGKICFQKFTSVHKKCLNDRKLIYLRTNLLHCLSVGLLVLVLLL